ncbi:MAG: cysteine dioxygenase family protein [Cyanobacteria bacterium REEB65]|nr:cysteine dioxygenase family protein [Cyanobacteria bacterium REEB65]
MSLLDREGIMTWDEFLTLVAGMQKDELPVERLIELVKNLEITPELIEPNKHFDTQKYARNLLVKNHLFEAVCMCWEAGQETVVHNHGDSFGVFYVYEGQLAFDTFERQDDGSSPGMAEIRQSGHQRANPGQVAWARIGEIHKMGNAPDHQGRTVSVHFYAGPMARMDVFDPSAGTVETVEMAYNTAAVGEPA